MAQQKLSMLPAQPWAESLLPANTGHPLQYGECLPYFSWKWKLLWMKQ